MKRKLKTWKAFVAEFRPFADKWIGTTFIKYNNMNWHITARMIKLFGTEMEFRKLDHYSENYTHYGCNGIGYSWHELWFESEEFFKEEEFKI